MKKIHIKESSLENNFNEDLEPMSDFEKRVKTAIEKYEAKSPRERYLDLIKDEEIPDNLFYKEGLDDDENSARQFILNAANEGIISFKNIKEYIESNPYVRGNPDKFKGYLEKIIRIISGIDDFIDNYGK
jgi:hypothetical protein